MGTIHGIHHITCIAGDAQENLDFYAGVMGMHLVKRTVNQDVPDTYHLFFADGPGTPGTDLTFFPWPNMSAGRPGTGLTVEIPFAIQKGSLAYWQDRFLRNNVNTKPLEERFGELTLPFLDVHGTQLALVESNEERPFTPWVKSPVPAENQLRGMHSIRVWEREIKPTTDFLNQGLGFRHVGSEGGWYRYAADEGGSGKFVDIKELPNQRRGQWGTGSVHHVAWRVKDTAEQMELREVINNAGVKPTPQIDRFWFKSVYFREPGGALFELATEGPGFSRDEAPDELGTHLILPPWLEDRRHAIEAVLPPLELPHHSDSVGHPLGAVK